MVWQTRSMMARLEQAPRHAHTSLQRFSCCQVLPAAISHNQEPGALLPKPGLTNLLAFLTYATHSALLSIPLPCLHITFRTPSCPSGCTCRRCCLCQQRRGGRGSSTVQALASTIFCIVLLLPSQHLPGTWCKLAILLTSCQGLVYSQSRRDVRATTSRRAH
jgi:hypothetical protein